MPLKTSRNEYNGLNAHLMGYLMDHSDLWESFHTEHIAQIQRAVSMQLPDGFYARVIKSLQTGELALYEEMLTCVMIYQLSHSERPGAKDRPVLRIEIMSAASKQPGSSYTKYTFRRRNLLEFGVSLLEIDYLHHIRPIISSVPSYALGFPDTKPYHIILTDPRPSLQDAKQEIYSWGVDEAIPALNLVLDEGQSISFDLGATYDCAYNESRLYPQLVDYAVLPDAFESFTPDDQKRIRARMELVMAAQKNPNASETSANAGRSGEGRAERRVDDPVFGDNAG